VAARKPKPDRVPKTRAAKNKSIPVKPLRLEDNRKSCAFYPNRVCEPVKGSPACDGCREEGLDLEPLPELEKLRVRMAREKESGTRKHISDEMIQLAILQSHGLESIAAKALGISHQALKRRLAENPAILDDITVSTKDALMDAAEFTLYKMALEDRNMTALTKVLDTHGKGRGYGGGEAQTHSQAQAIQVVFNTTGAKDSEPLSFREMTAKIAKGEVENPFYNPDGTPKEVAHE
jgi:hypothetical protein